MFGESVFALIPDHEVRAAKLTNGWISGCWWGRDASSDEHLVWTKHGLLKCRSVRRKPPGEQWSRRETVEARGTKWNFDVEMDSGISGPPVTSRPDERMPTATAPMEIPTVPPPAPRPEEHVFDMKVHSSSGRADVAVKTKMVICEIVRYTNILEAPIPERGRQIDRHWPDHHYTEVASTQERHQRDDGIVVKTGHFREQVHHYCEHRPGDRCNLSGDSSTEAYTNDGDRRGFTVKPTAKYVDECLDIVQLQNEKAVMTPLTEQKSLNLFNIHCPELLFGKLQYITGVRPDLMFATKCLSYKLASPTLADLTRAKKVLRYLRGTRELNLYLTIPALKPNDLNKTLKHITGYSDADCAGDPVTRKSTSCTLCYVDQFLLTSNVEDRGLLPCPVENQKCMLLVHCQLS